MKIGSPAKATGAFSRLDALIITILLLVLFALLLPRPVIGTKMPAWRIYCMNNQRTVGLGLFAYREDHDGRFPWRVPNANNGTMETDEARSPAVQFATLTAYEVKPQNLICPSDKLKYSSTNSGELNNSNVSYFINFSATSNSVNLILAGDRHLEVEGEKVKPGVLALPPGTRLEWTRELHGRGPKPEGVLLFADGHREDSRSLTGILQQQSLVTNRFALP